MICGSRDVPEVVIDDPPSTFLRFTDPDTAANLARPNFVETLADLDERGGAEQVLSSVEYAVAIGVSLDNGQEMIIPANTSPGRRYIWLDLADQLPI